MAKFSHNDMMAAHVAGNLPTSNTQRCCMKYNKAEFIGRGKSEAGKEEGAGSVGNLRPWLSLPCGDSDKASGTQDIGD